MELKTARQMNAQLTGESESFPRVPAGRSLPNIRGINVVYGIREPKLIVGAPEGRQRLRMRNNSPAKLFVRTADGIRQFVLQDLGDRWFCYCEQGRNLKFAVTATMST
jgi:hypothetical protein